MIYKPFADLKLSALGFGAMRLPMLGEGAGAKVDEAETARLIAYAYEHGVNYYDTAYSYCNGGSEPAVGKALAAYPRDSFYLASKFPGHEVRPTYDVKAVFEEQLARCGVDYFDFYLLHNVCESSIQNYLDPKWGILDYLREQKKCGRIRHLGFSTHARPDALAAYLDRFGEDMEFCQIQLNYLDWTLQEAKAKYELLTERSLPVWVMEPVRGGRLAALAPEDEAVLKAARPEESIASWAFRYLNTLPNVHMILSGMSNLNDTEDNVKTFSTEKPLTGAEKDLLDQIAAGMMDLVPCTACRYCCLGCPMGLDIPKLLKLYNECRFQSGSLTVGMALDSLPESKRPTACISCGTCKKTCPQGIDVPAAMEDFAERMKDLPDWAAISRRRFELSQK